MLRICFFNNLKSSFKIHLEFFKKANNLRKKFHKILLLFPDSKFCEVLLVNLRDIQGKKCHLLRRELKMEDDGPFLTVDVSVCRRAKKNSIMCELRIHTSDVLVCLPILQSLKAPDAFIHSAHVVTTLVHAKSVL